MCVCARALLRSFIPAPLISFCGREGGMEGWREGGGLEARARVCDNAFLRSFIPAPSLPEGKEGGREGGMSVPGSCVCLEALLL